MKNANFAPVYCALYPAIAELTRRHGYALAIHGSLARDLDLICVPWTDKPSKPITVVNAITKTFAIKRIGKHEKKKHGRIAYTISVAFGDCAIDLSFMPTKQQSPEATNDTIVAAADNMHKAISNFLSDNSDSGEVHAIYAMQEALTAYEKARGE